MGSRNAGLTSALVRALFPHHCCGCGREGRALCESCRYRIQAPLKGLFVCPGCGTASATGGRCGRRGCDGPLDGLAAMAPYGDRTLGRLLRLYKYGRAIEAGAALRTLFGAFLAAHRPFFAAWSRDAAVVPVPGHFLRLAVRGFDQVAPFAGDFARAFGRPVVRPLSKAFRWSSQASLDEPAARTRNAKGSIVLTRPAPFACVLVDDVVTTGSTLRECAAALKSGGARFVVAVALLKG